MIHHIKSERFEYYKNNLPIQVKLNLLNGCTCTCIYCLPSRKIICSSLFLLENETQEFWEWSELADFFLIYVMNECWFCAKWGWWVRMRNALIWYIEWCAVALLLSLVISWVSNNTFIEHYQNCQISCFLHM